MIIEVYAEYTDDHSQWNQVCWLQVESEWVDSWQPGIMNVAPRHVCCTTTCGITKATNQMHYLTSALVDLPHRFVGMDQGPEFCTDCTSVRRAWLSKWICLGCQRTAVTWQERTQEKVHKRVINESFHAADRAHWCRWSVLVNAQHLSKKSLALELVSAGITKLTKMYRRSDTECNDVYIILRQRECWYLQECIVRSCEMRQVWRVESRWICSRWIYTCWSDPVLECTLYTIYWGCQWVKPGDWHLLYDHD